MHELAMNMLPHNYSPHKFCHHAKYRRLPDMHVRIVLLTQIGT